MDALRKDSRFSEPAALRTTQSVSAAISAKCEFTLATSRESGSAQCDRTISRLTGGNRSAKPDPDRAFGGTGILSTPAKRQSGLHAENPFRRARSCRRAEAVAAGSCLMKGFPGVETVACASNRKGLIRLPGGGRRARPNFLVSRSTAGRKQVELPRVCRKARIQTDEPEYDRRCRPARLQMSARAETMLLSEATPGCRSCQPARGAEWRA